MGRKYKIACVVLFSLGLVLLSALFFAGADIAVLNPKGLIAEKQRDLIVLATWTMLMVVIPVLIMAVVISWRYRARNTKATYRPDWDYSLLAESLWWGIPFVIIIMLSLIVWKSSYELDPFKPLESQNKSLKVQVVALPWKWLFIYPEQGIASLNYVQFPEKTSIDFEITADAPMNSFWIPQLGGQIYAMPGMKSELYLIANETGIYKGASAHLSGKGFSGMTFIAQSTTQEAFDSWVNGVKRSSSQLGSIAYGQLAEPSENNPVETYVLEQSDLFDQIIMKYMMPMQENQ
jgi:cytochrome o ubiquinol oxidase subunit 2